MRLAGKIGIVTGGGRGIGRAIALGFAAEGAAVALAATGREALEDTVAAIRAAGGRARVSVTDVADEGDVARMIADTVSEFGGIDVLVNNSGIAGPTSPVVEMERDAWDRTLAVNVTGAYLCAKHAVPHMIPRGGGRIINITSVAGRIGYALRSAYAVSKWGMIGLTRSLALEVGPHRITVNAIAPGATRGERLDTVIRNRAAALDRPAAEIEREFFVDPTALKTMVDPEEVAATAVFLASDAARSITGETLAVSAGFRV